MRIDVYLNLVGIFKTRSAAGKALSGGFVTMNGGKLKPSYVVETGDLLNVTKPDGRILAVRVTGIPEGKSLPKKERSKYFERVEDPS